MRVLALDIATSTGFAIGDVGGDPRSWTQRLADKGATPGEKASALLGALNDLCKVEKIDRVFIEAPFLNVPASAGNTTAKTVLDQYALAVVASGYFTRRSIRNEWVNVQRVRRHFLGEGMCRLGRKEVKRATIRRCEQLNLTPKNDDEADALALWDFGCALADPKGLANRIALERASC